jgi:hypothetical protein
MAKDCPKKKFNSRPLPKPSYIKVVEEEEDQEYYDEEEEEEPQEQDKMTKLANRMIQFSNDKKLKWMNAMRERGVDFRQV